jgi:hypothetical protein
MVGLLTCVAAPRYQGQQTKRGMMMKAMTRRQLYDKIGNNMVEVQKGRGRVGLMEHQSSLTQERLDEQVVVSFDFDGHCMLVFDVEEDEENEANYIGPVDCAPSERIYALPRTWVKKRANDDD